MIEALVIHSRSWQCGQEESVTSRDEAGEEDEDDEDDDDDDDGDVNISSLKSRLFFSAIL